jgi:hypothetical protein
MHLADALSKAHEDDDRDVAAWHSFYQAVIHCQSDPGTVIKSISSALRDRSGDDMSDAKIVFHALSVLAYHLSIYKAVECLPPFDCPRSGRLNHHGHLHAGAPVNVDRVWTLVKSRSDEANSFSISKLITRVSNFYGLSNSPGSIARALHLNAAALSEVGRRYISEYAKIDPLEAVVDYRSNPVIASSSTSSLPHKLPLLLARVDLESSPDAVIEGLILCVQSGLNVSASRFLIRLANLLLAEGRVAQTFLLLDDIRSVVLSDCSYSDQGCYFETQFKALLSITSADEDETIRLLVDAFKAAQLSISAYDKARERKLLIQSIEHMIGIVDNLNVPGIMNFYSVKLVNILRVEDEGILHFPDQDSNTDIFGTGQPKLPSDITLSPKGKRCIELPGPRSPQGGRGIQTLLSWRHPTTRDPNN